MNTLLHICCAPCSVACVESLRGETIEPTGFWYNPNIHPFTEYETRKNTLAAYAAEIRMELITQDRYGLREYLSRVSPDFEQRCAVCYQMRLDAAAKCAAENKFDSFTTTLLISPYQNHEQICGAARQVSRKYGVQFLYRDFRGLFREGQQKARELSLYMQKYCGCIFSEEERYRKRKTRSKPD